MTHEALEALAARCEQATAEQQADLIEDVFRLIDPPPQRMYSDAKRLVPTRPWEAWSERFERIEAMLQADAFVDAALTLVPEGWFIRELDGFPVWEATMVRRDDPIQVSAESHHLALAITAAALRAHAAKEGLASERT